MLGTGMIQGFEAACRELANLIFWQLRGREPPPPHFQKRRTLLEYGSRYGLRTLVETGTYRGDMIWAMRERFDRICSIEVDQRLFERARQRFSRLSHVEILHGDSGDVLPRVLPSITTPCLFWLDGHWSGGITGRGSKDTPIVEELRAILCHSRRDHVVLVDDARCFDGKSSYPTLDALAEMVARSGPSYEIRSEGDIIRITPRS